MKKALTILSANLILIGSVTAGDSYKKSDSERHDMSQRKQMSQQHDSARYEKVTDNLWKTELQSSDILDATVYSKNSQEVGTVTDFELNKDGDIEALYVELEDGVLGLFGNTVVRVKFDDFKFDQEKGEFRVRESYSEQFAEFVSAFIEETKEGADYVADNTEKGLKNLVRDLEEDEECGHHMENVSIDVDDDKVYVRGEVESERARNQIIDRIEDNTRLEVVDNLEISHDKKSKSKSKRY